MEVQEDDLNSRSGRSLSIKLTILGAVSGSIAALIGILPWMVDQLFTDAPPSDKPQAILFVEKITVNETNGGKPWDNPNGLPDLKITVENLTTKVQMEIPTAQDVLTVELKSRTVLVREGDRLRIKIRDKDRLNLDDVVGEITFQVTGKALQQQADEFQFAKVKSLQLKYELQ